MLASKSGSAAMATLCVFPLGIKICSFQFQARRGGRGATGAAQRDGRGAMGAARRARRDELQIQYCTEKKTSRKIPENSGNF